MSRPRHLSDYVVFSICEVKYSLLAVKYYDSHTTARTCTIVDNFCFTSVIVNCRLPLVYFRTCKIVDNHCFMSVIVNLSTTTVLRPQLENCRQSLFYVRNCILLSTTTVLRMQFTNYRQSLFYVSNCKLGDGYCFTCVILKLLTISVYVRNC